MVHLGEAGGAVTAPPGRALCQASTAGFESLAARGA
jgi:hypothetical protein